MNNDLIDTKGNSNDQKECNTEKFPQIKFDVS